MQRTLLQWSKENLLFKNTCRCSAHLNGCRSLLQTSLLLNTHVKILFSLKTFNQWCKSVVPDLCCARDQFNVRQYFPGPVQSCAHAQCVCIRRLFFCFSELLLVKLY